KIRCSAPSPERVRPGLPSAILARHKSPRLVARSDAGAGGAPSGAAAPQHLGVGRPLRVLEVRRVAASDPGRAGIVSAGRIEFLQASGGSGDPGRLARGPEAARPDASAAPGGD